MEEECETGLRETGRGQVVMWLGWSERGKWIGETKDRISER